MASRIMRTALWQFAFYLITADVLRAYQACRGSSYTWDTGQGLLCTRLSELFRVLGLAAMEDISRY